MTGQSTVAAERSAHPPAAGTRALPDWLTQVGPGTWRMTAYVEADNLRAQLATSPARPAGGIASARITIALREGATPEELLAMAAEFASHNLRATPAALRAAAAGLVDRANRIEREGRAP